MILVPKWIVGLLASVFLHSVAMVVFFHGIVSLNILTIIGFLSLTPHLILNFLLMGKLPG